ncbi:uncharacterized protein LOC118312268 isoform X3 [Scophthalmus maximus]|uniref:uncharacterized protein LOC118312268 isoform X3 n=1 Tax=Scophthalmus maximus TaxID=52904 RepID=UPI001FA8AE69|nr:uncharacterized protein LOC118312268 isoform X3 [Scophthalmus maximus]
MDTDGRECELAKLRRQFRIIEGDRLAYNIQALEQIRKQQQAIDKLLEEQEELHGKLSVSKRLSGQQQHSKDTASLRALLEQTDTLEAELGKEKQCQKVLEKEISNMQLKLVKLRRGEAITCDTQRCEARRTLKAARTLECKLDRELQGLRKKIGERINLSTAAFDARVEAHCIMTMMREKDLPEDELGQSNRAEALRVQINWFQEEMEKFGVEGSQPEDDHRSLLRNM